MFQKFIKLKCYQVEYTIAVVLGLRGEERAIITSGKHHLIAISEIYLTLCLLEISCSAFSQTGLLHLEWQH